MNQLRDLKMDKHESTKRPEKWKNINFRGYCLNISDNLLEDPN